MCADQFVSGTECANMQSNPKSYHKITLVIEYLRIMPLQFIIKRIFTLFSFCFFLNSLFAQHADSVVQRFLISAEVRPRAEYRYNYIFPPNDSLSPDLYINQRNRITALFERSKWLIKCSAQEIHVWKDENTISKTGSINLYLLYAESKFRSVNFRIGRQGVLFDNGRIFSDAPWAQQGRAHEGIRFMKYSKKVSTDLLFLFTRKYDQPFDAEYSPVAAHKYKYLLIHHLSYKSNTGFSFNTINTVDFFENVKTHKLYTRATLGGRAEFKSKQWYYTVNSFIQFGEYPPGKNVLAYYIQPEVRLSMKKYTIRLGAELLSGSSPHQDATHSGNFDVLYGVTWKFMGNMNIFTRFPTDVAGKGLINPYLFVGVPVHKKLSLRSDFHLFFTQYHLQNQSGQNLNNYLGFETDLSLKYIPVKNIEINYGFSLLKSGASMRYLPKVLDENKLSVWSYFMISYTFNALDRTRYSTQ
jgi:hypothetical protein